MITSYTDGTPGNQDHEGAFEALNIAMYKEGKTSGNMKDVVSAEETAFGAVCRDAFMVCFNEAYRRIILELLANSAESDTDEIADNRPPVITYTSMNLELQNMQEKNLVIPDHISKMIKDLTFLIKIQESYSVGSLILPPRYLVPFSPFMDFANVQSYNSDWAQNNALAKLHMDKFGIKYHKFSDSDIPEAPEVSTSSSKAIAYFNHMPLVVRDAANDQPIYPYASIAGTATWTGILYYFKENPDEDPLHILLPILVNAYHVDNNPYGGMLSFRYCTDTQNHVCIVSSSYTNTSTWTSALEYEIVFYFLATYKQTNTFNVSLTGTYRTADSDYSGWLWAIMNGCAYGTGLTKTSIENILKGYMTKLAYGQGGTGRGSPKKAVVVTTEVPE